MPAAEHHGDTSWSSNSAQTKPRSVHQFCQTNGNVMQRPLYTEKIEVFKKHQPNPTEQQIVEACQVYIRVRLQRTGALTPPTTTET